MSGPLLILAAALLALGYAAIYTGASLGTSWQTGYGEALLGGLKFLNAPSAGSKTSSQTPQAVPPIGTVMA